MTLGTKGARWVSVVAAAALLAGTVGAQGAAMAASRKPAGTKVATLLETGSSLLYPLFNIWIPSYNKVHPNVQITPGSTGSGTGISDAEDGTVQIGASDAYLPPTAKSTNGGSMLNVPLGISAQMINFNLPGLNAKHLHLNGPILAGIFSGKIKKWNAPAIAKLNKGVKLPNHAIIPIRRIDGSGDTFLFTQYMTFSAGSAWAPGYGTTVNWPAVGNEISAQGNSGMVTALNSTPYGVAYIGISYENEIVSHKLGIAAIENKAGKFLTPNPSDIQFAAAAMVSKTPSSEALSLIFSPGANSYPIINYEYAILDTKQANATDAKWVKDFLTWCLTTGQSMSYLNQVHFQPLPHFVVNMSKAQLNRLQG